MRRSRKNRKTIKKIQATQVAQPVQAVTNVVAQPTHEMSLDGTIKYTYTPRDVMTTRAWFKKTPVWRLMLAYYLARIRWQWLSMLVLLGFVATWWLGVEFAKHITMWLTIEQVVHQFGARVLTASAEATVSNL